MKRGENMTRLSQQLRKNATPEENTLWYQYLRNYPVRFHRQFVLGQYIVDFYCAKAKLVLELDGSQHYDPETVAKDAQRTAYLESIDLMVMRFSNEDIKRNLRGVCEQIDRVVKGRISE
ncbi:MAG: endonuclease domain-containing protein [Faecousia sp.]